jgi:RNA polymerase sigma-70 factor (ECF subfamily)
VIFEISPARPSPELATLIHRSAAGDTSAFMELFDATSARVYSIALRVLGSPALAEECARAVYQRLWETSARFDVDRSSPMAWVLVAVLHGVTQQRLGPAGLSASGVPGDLERARPIGFGGTPAGSLLGWIRHRAAR